MPDPDDAPPPIDPASHLVDPESPYGFTGGDILHPSDLSVDEGRAFAHALAIALRLQSTLSLLHAGQRSSVIDGMAYPHVRETLIRWGLLDKGSPREAVWDELGIEVKKLSPKKLSPMEAIEKHLAERATDMVVMATRGRDGMPRWLKPSVSDKLAKRAPARTLYVPTDVRGFVQAETGEIRLRRIVTPLDPELDPRIAMRAADRIAQILGQTGVEFVAVRVGGGQTFDDVDLSDTPRGSWSTETRKGSPAKEIVDVAIGCDADLIIMVTEGRQGFLDALRGSTTAQVLHEAPCPLAALPAYMFDR
jgi:nucleotide-binding universal stress UspA family protein